MEDDIRAVQKKELEILKAVAKVCDDNGLRYFAVSGTALGAVRHQGFIPWDDDMDIGMPRKDYERFRQIAPQALPEHLRLMDYDLERQMVFHFLKVHDIRTTDIEIETLPYPGKYTGVYIDIFPYDGCPSSPEEQRKLKRRMERLRGVNYLLRRDAPSPPLRRLKKLIVDAVLLVLPWNWASRRLDAIMRGYDLDQCEMAHVQKWCVFPAQCVRESVYLPFEDMMLPCPGGYDVYLTALYGDYMTPPPEAERSSGHNIAYRSVERSYLDRWWEKEEKQ